MENIVDERLTKALEQFAESVKDIMQDYKPKGISNEYAEYLKTPEWQAKRNERLRIDNYTCQRCGGKRNLQVHHLTYANIGCEDVYNDLITMCEACHDDIESEKRKRREYKDFVKSDVERRKRVEEKVQKQVEEHLKKVEEIKRKREKEREVKVSNTFKFLDACKCRDIGFGGRENLCNAYLLTKLIEHIGLTKEDVLFWRIQRYFTYYRWVRARDLHDKGLSIAQIAKDMGWKKDKVEKALSKENGDGVFNELSEEVFRLELEKYPCPF